MNETEGRGIDMETLKIWNDRPSDKQLQEITETLENGGIIIIPTDTLYGIACDCTNSKAIEKVCRLKGITPEKSTLSIICSDISMAAEYSRYGNDAFKLMRQLTPGPYTFIFKSATILPKAFKGRKTVGVRIPDAATPRMIAEALGRPLMNTSIEYEDEDYARNPELIAERYADLVDLVLLGEEGDTTPSTIIEFTGRGPEITRQGKGEPI